MLLHIQKLPKAKIKHNIAFHATIKTKMTIYVLFIGKLFPPLILHTPQKNDEVSTPALKLNGIQ